MRLSGILVFMCVFIILNTHASGEELILKLNQKEVDISGKIEKFYSLFADPPLELKVSGPSKFVIITRKIIDKKNPLTKLPVTLTVNLDDNKVREILLNDRDGSAVIKDATMFNAGQENRVEFSVPEGEHTIKINVTKSAIKGLLIRIEKVSEEKTAVVSPPAQDEKEKDKEFIPPLIPPLLPLVPPTEKQDISSTTTPPGPQESTSPVEEKKATPPQITTAQQAPKHTIAVDKTTTSTTSEPTTQKTSEFGNIVIFSVKGGTILPLEYGNPGGYGEFSTSFKIYKNLIAGTSIASYNINRDYIINDINTGNDILKYHLHGVPISIFLGYKHQMHNILTRFELGSGINMVDLDIRRKNTSDSTDTINSFQINAAAEICYIFKKYGSTGMGLKYIHSISDNIDKDNGFAENINSGGLVLTIGYYYGF